MRRILLDQGLPPYVGRLMRDAGWDAEHVREIGMHSASDQEILEHAARDSIVVVTLDRDFPQLLALLGTARPSVVLIRQQRLRAADLMEILTSVWAEYEAHLDRGGVLTVGKHGTRLRILPIP